MADDSECPQSVDDACHLTKDSHPYSPGGLVQFKIGDTVHTAKIKQVFSGSRDVVFTKSCTILIEISTELAQNVGSVTQDGSPIVLVVVKVFDARYAQQIRSRYGLGPWNSKFEKAGAYVPYADRWRERAPSEILDQPQVQHALAKHGRPSASGFGELVDCGFRHEEVMNALVEVSFFPEPVDECDREQYANNVCLGLCRLEQRVFAITQARGVFALPKYLHTVQVTTSCAGGHAGAGDVTPRPGIMMEYLPGVNLSTWKMDNKACQTDLAGRPLTLRDLRDVHFGLLTSLHALVYCGLRPSYIHEDNVNVFRSPNGRLRVRLYDAGSSAIVRKQTIGLDKNYIRQSFEQDCKDLVVRGIDALSKPGNDAILSRMLPTTECFKGDQSEKDCLQRVILLCIWYFDDATQAIKRVPYTVDALCKAQFVIARTWVLLEEQRVLLRRYWIFVAAARVMYLLRGREDEEDYLRAADLLSNAFYLSLFRSAGSSRPSESWPWRIMLGTPGLRQLIRQGRDTRSTQISQLEVDAAIEYQPDVTKIRQIVDARIPTPAAVE